MRSNIRTLTENHPYCLSSLPLSHMLAFVNPLFLVFLPSFDLTLYVVLSSNSMEVIPLVVCMLVWVCWFTEIAIIHPLVRSKCSTAYRL